MIKEVGVIGRISRSLCYEVQKMTTKRMQTRVLRRRFRCIINIKSEIGIKTIVNSLLKRLVVEVK